MLQNAQHDGINTTEMIPLLILYLFTYTGVQHDLSMSFKINTTGVTCASGTTNHSESTRVHPSF
jgi:hypothetical protein